MPPVLRLASLAVVVAAVSLVAAPPRTADACSASCNDPGFFVPGDGATVPANLPGIFWRPRYDLFNTPPNVANVRLTTAADPGTALPFTAQMLGDHQYLLVPDAPLVAGTSYIATDSTMCAGGVPSPTVTFAVGPSAPLPTTLGTLAITDLPPQTEAIASSGGSCTLQALADTVAVSIDYFAVPEAAPWRDVLHFETRVDGQPWNARASILQSIAPGASWAGRGVDRLYTVCRVEDPFGQSATFELAEGAHTVQLRATLPGTNLSLATDTPMVSLACPALSDGDAGIGDDAGDPTVTEPSGCCSSSTSPEAPVFLALAVVALLTTARRPRRRSRSAWPEPPTTAP